MSVTSSSRFRKEVRRQTGWGRREEVEQEVEDEGGRVRDE